MSGSSSLFLRPPSPFVPMQLQRLENRFPISVGLHFVKINKICLFNLLLSLPPGINHGLPVMIIAFGSTVLIDQCLERAPVFIFMHVVAFHSERLKIKPNPPKFRDLQAADNFLSNNKLELSQSLKNKLSNI
jgi:hypothetical protein